MYHACGIFRLVVETRCKKLNGDGLTIIVIRRDRVLAYRS